jgi:thiosulfate reductase cytochrome b subunit/DMSO/TMAO reductase YedYZ molybdopterin-dependent catalytic subunit
MSADNRHSIWVRITHWVNFLVLSVMIWSGFLILWANREYWPRLPEGFYKIFGLEYRLAEGMSYHFAFMWFFGINTLIYAGYVFASGHWREMFPGRTSFRDALLVVAHDLKLRKELPPQGRFNAAQKFAYTAVLFMLLLALISGIAIYKPVQLHWLKNLFVNYTFARTLHYWLALGFVGFFFIHIAQVAKAGWNNFASMVGRRVGFAVFAVAMIAAVFVWHSLRVASQVDDVRAPLRGFLQFNERLAQSFLSIDRVDQTHAELPKGKPARVNGDLGLEGDVDEGKWTVTIEAPPQQAGLAPRVFVLAMQELKSIPKTDIHTELRCVEGWSQVMSFGGVPFREILLRYNLGTHSGRTPDWKNHPDDLYKYVGLETPDGEYYVSNDMKSMLNPHTMLAYEQNGEPLSLEHGAPLRLYIPNKYGVKSLKRVSKIVFSDTPLPDYWGERGYDWYLGL